MKKLNWIDLLGIGIFFFVLASVAFFMRRQATNLTIVVKINQNLDYGQQSSWYLDKLRPGLEQKGITGKTDISVVEVTSQFSDHNIRTY